MKDPTLERIWQARDAIAKRAGYDAKTLVAQLREREKKSKKSEKRDHLIVRESDVTYGSSS